MQQQKLILTIFAFLVQNVCANSDVKNGYSNEKTSHWNESLPSSTKKHQHIPGGGELLLILNKKDFLHNSTEPIPHPENDKYYHILKNNSIIVMKCPVQHVFNSEAKKCVKQNAHQQNHREHSLPYKCDIELKCKFHNCKAPINYSSLHNICQQATKDEHSMEEISSSCSPLGSTTHPMDCAIYYTCKTKSGDVFLKTRYKCPKNGRRWESLESIEQESSMQLTSSEQDSSEYYEDRSDSSEYIENYGSTSESVENSSGASEEIHGQTLSEESSVLDSTKSKISNVKNQKNTANRKKGKPRSSTSSQKRNKLKTRTSKKSSYFVPNEKKSKDVVKHNSPQKEPLQHAQIDEINDSEMIPKKSIEITEEPQHQNFSKKPFNEVVTSPTALSSEITPEIEATVIPDLAVTPNVMKATSVPFLDISDEIVGLSTTTSPKYEFTSFTSSNLQTSFEDTTLAASITPMQTVSMASTDEYTTEMTPTTTKPLQTSPITLHESSSTDQAWKDLKSMDLILLDKSSNDEVSTTDHGVTVKMLTEPANIFNQTKSPSPTTMLATTTIEKNETIAQINPLDFTSSLASRIEIFIKNPTELITEVEQHGVIYNRQKYYLNTNAASSMGASSQAGKYETKDDAWQLIAMKLRSDVETCKKRWKYLRERYVSQRKQGDPPVYEHLSRPYLEKMKFLDQHIQPRKSYRSLPNFLTSPNVHSSGYVEYNMDSSKSNGSLKNVNCSQYQDAAVHMINSVENQNGISNNNGSNVVKTEAEQAFRDFAAAVASQQLQQINNTQSNQNINHQHHSELDVPTPVQDAYDQYRENNGNSSIRHVNGVASSSSSMKSPVSSPKLASKSLVATAQAGVHVDSNLNNHLSEEVGHEDSNNFHMKKPRVQLRSVSAKASENLSTPASHVNHYVVDSDDDSDVDNSPSVLNDGNSHYYNHARGGSNSTNIANGENHNHQTVFPSNADFLFSLYQQMPPQHRQLLPHSHLQQMHQDQQQHPAHHFNKLPIIQTPPNRSSEHLLGELVTTELLKMSKERRKNVQKRILEILFFDD